MSEIIITPKINNKLIIAFGGNIPHITRGMIFEFYNFINETYSDYDRMFYIDKNKNCYHSGIEGISKSIDETVDYLRDKIKDYDEVTFVGHSAGGYISILLGSLLNVHNVIAFIPQTILYSKLKEEKYKDIKKYINNTTKYYVYGDINEKLFMYHHISHCEYIEEFENVTVFKLKCVNILNMRNSGELKIIFNKIL